jgi:biopolymer transport protein ExbD
MARKSSRSRLSNEVNAGSMADIAFLLLIFFLVTTTIAEDKGVLVLLPPWSDEEPQSIKLKERNVFSVLVNANDQLLVRGQEMPIGQLRATAKEFILNPSQRMDMSESPKKAIISLKNDRGTHYFRYLEVYNELKAAYNELRNERAQQQFGRYFDDLTQDQRKIIINEIPLILSEAESTSFGEEDQ